MLKTFNYKIRSDSFSSKGFANRFSEQTSFLKTVVTGGLPNVKENDIYEKTFFGREIKRKGQPYIFYLLDRVNQLCITDYSVLRRLSFFLAICEYC